MDYEQRLTFLKEMSEAKGVSGDEKEVTRIMKKHLEGFADEFDYDNLGSLIAIKKGSGSVKVMLSGHVDEVGFVVKSIEDSGFIRFTPVGGWWAHVLPSQKVNITTKDGVNFVGVIGSIPPHGMKPEVRNKVMELSDLYVDLGVKDRKEVESLGINIGDSITPYSQFFTMANKDYVCSKAFDDRVGAAVCSEVMMNLKGKNHPNILYSVGTVQEEVGLRGARTASFKIKPDVAIAVDVTMSHDIPSSEKGDTKLGAGVSLSVLDGTVIAHKGLLNYMSNLAKEKNIKFTYDTMSAGGTDSGEMHKVHEGVVNMTISIPCRYFHSNNSIINLNDYQAAIDLISEFVLRLDQKLLDELKASKR